MDINIQQILFYIFSSLTGVAGIFLLTTKNVVHAAFSFLAVLLGVAVVFVYANAEFAAVTQIMVYVGGVLILLIFGVMLTITYAEKERPVYSFQNILVYTVCSAFLIVLVYAINQSVFDSSRGQSTGYITDNFSLPQKIGYLLMTDYVVPFEASGVLLMVALLGAATIAGRK